MRAFAVPGHLALGLALVATLFAIPAITGSVRADDIAWMPIEGPTADVPGETVLYRGLTGVLVGADSGAAPADLPTGGRVVGVTPGETLWVFLVEDGERASFNPPARVLLRLENEVILATPGDVPELTPTSVQTLRGIQQPVRIDRTPRVRRTHPSPPPAQLRSADPVIQTMVGQLLSASYHTSWQALEDFVTRYTTAPQTTLATQWILDEFLAMGIAAEFHEYNQSGVRRNVVATIPGTVDPSKVVYITSHLDSTSPTPTTCAPGADDNGSGTAAVIEAARVLSQYAFEYTIKFACFNGEEQGLVGSGAYVSDIAAAGEDVIAAYNMDMIAYAGSDPAPPDLIIYTDTFSQSLATTLRDACLDYVPGLVEPVIVNQAISASDHASFWAHGYAAILAIEEEAWGADFCPWYHTCDDLISRYPVDYVVNCAKAVMAAAASTALPIDVAGPWLVVDQMQIDDDGIGASSGDNDGGVNPGETIELVIDLENLGTQSATSVSGLLSCTDPHVTVTGPASTWPDVPPAGQASPLAPFVFDVSGNAADGDMLAFSLTITDASGSRELGLQIPVTAPRMSYFVHRLDDSTPGNGNGLVEPGESVRLPVRIANAGGKDGVNVTATLSSSSFFVTVLENQGTSALITQGTDVELDPPFQIQIMSGTPLGTIIDLDLSITTALGYAATSGFQVKVGTSFFDAAEADGAWLLAAAGDDATTGRWERVDPNGTLQDGQPCQSEDDHTAAPGTDGYITGQSSVGATAGAADVDGGTTTLTSPTFDLTTLAAPRVRYWRWYSNNLGSNVDDEWVTQVSANGGISWVDLERTTSSPNAWEEMSFLLSEYVLPTSQVVFRFVASDLGSGSLVEAGIDDFEITSDLGPIATGTPPATLVFRLDAARPSPARRGTTIGFEIPDAGPVSLALFSVDGRRVRHLVDQSLEAGTFRVPWDGRNQSGHLAAPGIYFYRLDAGERSLVKRLVVID